MSEQKVAKETLVTVCDLCGEEIPSSIRGSLDYGSLISGYLMPSAESWMRKLILQWPPRNLWKKYGHESKRYDFHGKCITELVESHIAIRRAN